MGCLGKGGRLWLPAGAGHREDLAAEEFVPGLGLPVVGEVVGERPLPLRFRNGGR